MKRKVLSSVLSIALVIGCVTCNVSAKSEDTGYRLLYENTFDNGAEGGAAAFNKETDDFSLTLNANKTGWITAAFEGNTGVATRGDAWPAERTILFDFTKGGMTSTATRGIYKLSFDFSSSPNGGDSAFIGQNFMSNHWDGARIMFTNKGTGGVNFGVTGSAGGWGGNALELDNSKKYHVESVMNLDTKAAHTYVDGVLLGKTENLCNPMNNLSMALCAYWDYFDNLKLEYYDKVPMEMSVSDMTDEKVSLNFTDGIANKDILENGAVIKNMFTGEEFEAELVETSDVGVDVIPGKNLVPGYSYKLVLPKELKGNEGESLTENTAEVNFAVSNSIKSVRLRDLSGDEIGFSDENPAEIQSIIFEFTDDVNGKDALSELMIKDSRNNNLAFEIKGEDNVGEAVLKDVLIGNEAYTITLNGLSVSYEIPLNTGEGRIAFCPAKLYKADGVTEITSVSDISAGEKVITSFETVNTSNSTIKYFAVTAMYNGKLMSEVDAETAELLPGNKKTTKFSFTVSDKTGLKFIGTLWDGEKVWPITDEVNFLVSE